MRNTHKGLLTVVMILAVTLISSGSVYASDSLKIGVINLQYIMSNSTVAKVVKNKLQAKGAELQKNVKKESDKYEALSKEIEKKKTVWSQEILQGKLRELQKIEEMGKIVSRDATFELQSMEKKLMGPVLNELGNLIDSYGKQKGFSVILDNTGQGARSGLLYVDKTLDISEIILKELDKKLANKK